jgi:D-aspartate ligase
MDHITGTPAPNAPHLDRGAKGKGVAAADEGDEGGEHRPAGMQASSATAVAARPPGALLDTSTTAVLVQAAAHGVQHGLLGAARSLGRLGVNVVSVLDRRGGAATRSRYLRHSVTLDLLSTDPEALLDVLRPLARGQRPPLLVPLDDAATLYIEQAAALRQHCLLPDRPAGLLAQLLDKAELARLLERLGIPGARSRVATTRDELLDAAHAIGLPAVLKTCGGITAPGAAKFVRVLRSRRELVRTYDELRSSRDCTVLLQEYIPAAGGCVDWIFNACFDRTSRCVFSGTGPKLRQSPLGTGAATFGQAVPNPKVEALGHRLAALIGYAGIVDLDFRFDSRDSRYKLLDVNPRLGASFRMFVSENGLDVLRAHYLTMTGQPFAACRASSGRSWMVEQRDLPTSIRLMWRGELAPREWLSSVRHVDEWAWYDPADLSPVRSMLTHYLDRLARRWRS